MWAFSAIRKAEGLSLAATNRLHIKQYDSIGGDMPRTGRCSNRGAGDFEGMGLWKVLRIVTAGTGSKRNLFCFSIS
jgi:hypothetical protein